jgi:hypothetical protein
MSWRDCIASDRFAGVSKTMNKVLASVGVVGMAMFILESASQPVASAKSLSVCFTAAPRQENFDRRFDWRPKR